jgi:hypothetical protein
MKPFEEQLRSDTSGLRGIYWRGMARGMIPDTAKSVMTFGHRSFPSQRSMGASVNVANGKMSR